MHYAMEPRQLSNKRDLKEKQLLTSYIPPSQQQNPYTYTFRMSFDGNESPYNLAVFLNGVKESSIKLGQQHPDVAIDLFDDKNIRSIGVYKNDQVVATKDLKDFLSILKEQRFYDDLPYGSFSQLEPWDVASTREQLHGTNDKRALFSFSLDQANHVIDIRASIKKHINYDYKTISFCSLFLCAQTSKIKDCTIPLEPREKTFLERHWYYRTDEENRCCALLLCQTFPWSIPLVIATALIKKCIQRKRDLACY